MIEYKVTAVYKVILLLVSINYYNGILTSFSFILFSIINLIIYNEV